MLNKMDVFEITVASLDPDIIGITKSWSNDDVLDSQLMLNGYELFRCDRSTGNIGGGVLLHVKNNSTGTIYGHSLEPYGQPLQDVLKFHCRFFRYFVISSFLSCHFSTYCLCLFLVSPLCIIQSEFVPFLFLFIRHTLFISVIIAHPLVS